MDQDKVKHLEFIQNIITRMNTNSFQIKSLTVTIVAAFIAIYATNQKLVFIIIGIVPTIVFWFLDTYYLQLERKFRGVYNDVAGITKINDVKLYDMPINMYKGDEFCYLKVFISPTIIWFYLPIILFLFISFLIFFCKNS